jgi:tRNA-(ms[2]io[6]A)-hydroxylase
MKIIFSFALMLGLKLATDPRWANAAEKSIDEILIDHAYCEQKAATTGISLIVQYPEMEKMVKECTAIVAEEWGHFRKVLKELDKRDFKFGPQRKDIYVNEFLRVHQKRHYNFLLCWRIPKGILQKCFALHLC